MSRWVNLNQARAKASAEFIGILQEAPGDGLIDGIHPQGQVSRGHHGRMSLLRIVSVRNGIGCVLDQWGSIARPRQGSSPDPNRRRTGFRDSCCPTPPEWVSRRPRCHW